MYIVFIYMYTYTYRVSFESHLRQLSFFIFPLPRCLSLFLSFFLSFYISDNIMYMYMYMLSCVTCKDTCSYQLCYNSDTSNSLSTDKEMGCDNKYFHNPSSQNHVYTLSSICTVHVYVSMYLFVYLLQ